MYHPDNHRRNSESPQPSCPGFILRFFLMILEKSMLIFLLKKFPEIFRNIP